MGSAYLRFFPPRAVVANGRETCERTAGARFGWPVRRDVVIFWEVGGGEEDLSFASFFVESSSGMITLFFAMAPGNPGFSFLCWCSVSSFYVDGGGECKTVTWSTLCV